MPPTALVTGVAGQDGIYLSRLLLEHGTAVVGTVLPGSGAALQMAPYLEGVEVIEHDIRDTAGLGAILREHRPTEVYNLAGFTSVGASWGSPELVAETNGEAVRRMLDLLVVEGPETRFFQASSAEGLGSAANSPYARAKTAAQEHVRAAREEHGLFACSGVMFNHESPVRGHQFVTRKITRAAAEIRLGRGEPVHLGNLAVARDWGHARDYVEAVRLMLQQPSPNDVMIATGVAHTLRELVEAAFTAAGVGDAWGHVVQDPALVRPADAELIVGDPRAAAETLGWTARTTFAELVDEMVRVDLKRVETGVEEAVSYLNLP